MVSSMLGGQSFSFKVFGSGKSFSSIFSASFLAGALTYELKSGQRASGLEVIIEIATFTPKQKHLSGAGSEQFSLPSFSRFFTRRIGMGENEDYRVAQ
jgi:hypothetical protein